MVGDKGKGKGKGESGYAAQPQQGMVPSQQLQPTPAQASASSGYVLLADGAPAAKRPRTDQFGNVILDGLPGTTTGEVRYAEAEAAAQASVVLCGTELGGRPITVELDLQDRTRLIVSGIPDGLGWADLKGHFESVGTVVFADVGPSVGPVPAAPQFLQAPPAPAPPGGCVQADACQVPQPPPQVPQPLQALQELAAAAGAPLQAVGSLPIPPPPPPVAVAVAAAPAAVEHVATATATVRYETSEEAQQAVSTLDQLDLQDGPPAAPRGPSSAAGPFLGADTAQQMDDLCGRLERLADQVKNPGLTTREDVVVSEVVGVIQRIGEGVAWAYGQHRSKPGLGERFAQPFVDHHIKWLKALLVEKRPLRRENQNRLVGQILQTIHILLQATPPDSMLFCNLTAGWYLNEVVSAKIDFLDNEDLLPLWMTVVKDIATMLDRDNLMLFFDPSSDKPFPIFSEACRYYHHPVSQVRTHVQATSLEIFLKLRDKSFWNEPLFHKVLQESSVFFTHVCCLLRDFWQMADEAVHTQERRNVRSALYIQNDILMYVNDIFMCEIPQLTAILQEKLLRFAILPVLVRSILRPRDPPTIREQQQDLLSAPTAWYLLHDMLVTLQSSPVFTAVSLALLRKDVPEEVLKLVTEHHSRTPITYFKTQAEWGGTIRPAPDLTGDVASDEVLYAMPREHLVQLLENRGHMVKNSLLDALLERLQGLSRSESGLSAVADSLLLDTTTLLLRTLRAGSEVLDEDKTSPRGSRRPPARYWHSIGSCRGRLWRRRCWRCES
ncbi:unnamed protein product [Prorocentrum cordatum]|uniref:FPL domain-containing protein n=1 Tax=Prorocentrum cordatum TaxID=2364126 RepID=A0ABN9QXG6_9DINO|nr:unnamed protein product [Polarella glacialis]